MLHNTVTQYLYKYSLYSWDHSRSCNDFIPEVFFANSASFCCKGFVACLNRIERCMLYCSGHACSWWFMNPLTLLLLGNWSLYSSCICTRHYMFFLSPLVCVCSPWIIIKISGLLSNMQTSSSKICPEVKLLFKIMLCWMWRQTNTIQ